MKHTHHISPLLWGLARRLRFVAYLLAPLWLATWWVLGF